MKNKRVISERLSMGKILMVFMGVVVALGLFTGSTYAVWPDPTLKGDRPVYIQNVTTNSVDIVWKTASSGTPSVNYGTSPTYGLQNTGTSKKTIENAIGNLHKVTLSGLAPNTKYYYQLVVGGSGLTSSGDTSYFFKTAPDCSNPLSTSCSFSFAVWGDSGVGQTPQVNVARQVNNRHPDLVLIAGDVAYGNGGYGVGGGPSSEGEQDRLYFDIYKDTMKYVPFYPSCGNHDDNLVSGSINGCDVMMNEHSLPGGGKMGSGVNSTFSWDYGNVHFVSLYTGGGITYSGPGSGDPQMVWAYNDLKNSQKPWKIMYFHYNGWSSGSHSTNSNVIANILKMAQDAGVNGVFWGHSHVFERFAPGTGGFPFYYTIGNGGRGGTSSCASPCVAASGYKGIPSGSGFLYAQVTGGTMKVDYIDQTGFNNTGLQQNGLPYDSATYTLGATTVVPTNTPGAATNTPIPTATKTPTQAPSATPQYTTTPPTPTPTQCPSLPNNTGSATLNVNIPTNGDYVVWSRIMAPNNTDNSYFLQVGNSGCPNIVGDAAITPSTWQWVDFRNGSGQSRIILPGLSAGSHSVQLVGRESNVKVDRLIFTTDLSCIPVLDGSNCLIVASATPLPTSITPSNTPSVPSPTSTDTINPTVNISSPQNGQNVSGIVNVAVSSQDNIGVSEVKLFIDDVKVNTSSNANFSYSWDTTKETNGSHTLRATALDNAGNSGNSPSVAVTVGNNDTTNPTVKINSPVDQSSVSGDVQIKVSASDNVAVEKVQLYVDGVSTDNDSTDPYVFLWDTTTVTDGSHTLMAKAIDGSGNSKSDSVAVSVNNNTSEQTLKFKPVDDATIDKAEPRDNFGNTKSLEVDKSDLKNFLLKFDIQGVGNRKVVKAKLKLYNINRSNIGGYFYKMNSNDWNENNVNWNNAPGYSSNVIDKLGDVSPGEWYKVDLTSVVQSDGLISIRVTSPSSNGADYYSKEKDPGYAPRLLVTVK